MTEQTSSEMNTGMLSAKFLFLIFCYFGLHILLRVTVSDSFDYDEAEQVLLAQWLLPGYTEQPPLYTWLQFYLFQFFGKSVFAVSLLKNSLIFLTYVFVYLSGKIILKDTRMAILATCSLLLIPQISWESQRDMTHTTLVVFAASATLYQCLRLVNKKTILNYIVLGLLLGVGFMGKANFGLFLAVLLLAMLSTAEGRAVFLNKYIFISLCVMLAIAGNYFLWMYNNQDIVFSATHKFKRAVARYYIGGPLSLIRNSFLFFTPLWIFLLLIFPRGYGLTDNFSPTFEQKFIGRYILFLFFTVLAVVLLFKVTYVKDRWLQPLLFAAPIYFFSRLSPGDINPVKFKRFLIIAAVAATGIYIAFTLRVVSASYINQFCRLNYPISAITSELKETGFKEGLIISNNRFLAGNMVAAFPGSSTIIPGYHFEKIPSTRSHQNGLIVWKADFIKEIPKTLVDFIRDSYGVDANTLSPMYLIHPYKFARTETVTMGAILIPEMNFKRK
jgi:4-amino-4-deoxy-L-arabinose transferase-like glycosyltransferase